MTPPQNPSPLSQPTRYTCANCGFGWSEINLTIPPNSALQTPVTKPKAHTAHGCTVALLGALRTGLSMFGFGSMGNALTAFSSPTNTPTHFCPRCGASQQTPAR